MLFWRALFRFAIHLSAHEISSTQLHRYRTFHHYTVGGAMNNVRCLWVLLFRRLPPCSLTTSVHKGLCVKHGGGGHWWHWEKKEKECRIEGCTNNTSAGTIPAARAHGKVTDRSQDPTTPAIKAGGKCNILANRTFSSFQINRYVRKRVCYCQAKRCTAA